MPKNGVDNLKPPRTKDEARERGQNGGKASGEARRRKKALKEEFEILLSMPLADKALQDNLSALGVRVNGSMTIETPNREDKEREISERLELMKRAFTEHDGEEDEGDE